MTIAIYERNGMEGFSRLARFTDDRGFIDGGERFDWILDEDRNETRLLEMFTGPNHYAVPDDGEMPAELTRETPATASRREGETAPPRRTDESERRQP